MAKSEDRIDEIEARLKRVEAFVGISHQGIVPDVNVGSVPTPVAAPVPTNIANFLGVADPAEVDATDAARAKAEELGVDIATVEPGGAAGQVIVADVKAAAAEDDGA